MQCTIVIYISLMLLRCAMQSNRVTPSKEGQGSFDAEKQDDGDTRSIASCTSIAVDNHKSRNPVSLMELIIYCA